MEWQPIETAPTDGTAIQAEIPGHGRDNVIAWLDGFADSDERDCCAWAFVTEQEPPESWTDGVCWAVNEDGDKSTQPTRWKQLAAEHLRSAARVAGPLQRFVKQSKEER